MLAFKGEQLVLNACRHERVCDLVGTGKLELMYVSRPEVLWHLASSLCLADTS